jgi:hypothetical protein
MICITERWKITVVLVLSLLLGLTYVGSLRAQIKKEDVDFEYIATVTAEKGKNCCLWNMAERYYGDPYKWGIIMKANKIPDERKIPVGTVIYIPVLEAKKLVEKAEAEIEEKKGIEEKLLAEIAKLREEMHDSRKYKELEAKNKQLAKSLKELEAKNKQLAKSRPTKELQNRNKRLSQALKDKEAAIKKKDAIIKELEAEMRDLRAIIKRQKAELARLEEKKNRHIEELELELKKCRAEIEKLERMRDEANARIRRAEEEARAPRERAPERERRVRADREERPAPERDRPRERPVARRRPAEEKPADPKSWAAAIAIVVIGSVVWIASR